MEASVSACNTYDVYQYNITTDGMEASVSAVTGRSSNFICVEVTYFSVFDLLMK